MIPILFLHGRHKEPRLTTPADAKSRREAPLGSWVGTNGAFSRSILEEKWKPLGTYTSIEDEPEDTSLRLLP